MLEDLEKMLEAAYAHNCKEYRNLINVKKRNRQVVHGQESNSIWPVKPFSSMCKDILPIMEPSIFSENLLIWQNATYPETITLHKISGPRTVV